MGSRSIFLWIVFFYLFLRWEILGHISSDENRLERRKKKKGEAAEKENNIS